MNNFKEIIKKITPEHDYPAGLIHPYWARKPLNIIESIICHYSNVGDTVADPFMGSGTTIIAAVKNKRNVVGGDLSPISKLLVDSILFTAISPEKYIKILDVAVKDWTQFAISLYKVQDSRCVERESYFVDGEYIQGKFNLIFNEAKIKPIKDFTLQGKVELIKNVDFENALPLSYLNDPIDFSTIFFTENTRIAVHKGVKASDFFTKRNIIFINYVKKYIAENAFCLEYSSFLKLFLSSMIPLLRLSDKKASSQWPYWRPKNELTSRNPIVALKRRHKAFINCLNWEDGELNTLDINSQIYQLPAESLVKHYTNKVDLIVTDPPYADHAPYLEYSDLYWSIVEGENTQALWSKEIVKTNAIGREKDSLCYESRMFNSLCSTLSMLKDEGYFIFFYLDKNINHWASIKSAIYNSDCIVEDVIAIPKQRRSMKAVTSPGKTLDGDLIIVCKKTTSSLNHQKVSVQLQDILDEIDGDTYFERFGEFIKKYLSTNISDLENWSLKDISRII